jgi:hypothetical protein
MPTRAGASPRPNRRRRISLAMAIAIAAILAVLWLAGESHRGNCIREGRTGCSVLPWIQGEARPRTGNPFNQIENPFNNVHP